MSGARGGRGSIGIGGGGGRYQLRAMDLHVPQQRLQQQQFQQQLPQPLSGLPQLQPEVLPQQDQGLPQQAQVLPQHQQQHGENSAMSARHMLIRRKLMERKRFDSADYAMDKNKRKKEDGADEHDVPDTSMGSGTEPGNAVRAATAQAGASALYSALHDGSGEQDAVMAEAEPQAPSPAEAEAAERYGGLTRGGAASARHILLQKKLREKKHFDSADYQLARAGSGNSSPASPASPASGDSGAASPMDVDDEVGDAVAAVDNINSPSAALRADHRVAQMSPSVRAAKYGGLDKPSGGSDRLRLRQRLADKSAEQYRRSEAAASSPSREEQDQGRFFVPAASNSPVAAGRNAAATESGGGASRYGRLCAANVLIRRKLKERKRFDSADYAMQKDGEVEAAAEAEEEQGGSAGAIVDGQVVMTSPTPPHRHHPGTDEAMFFAQEGDATTSPSISHQVKHIKLSEGSGGGGWAGVLASKASMAPPPVPMEMAAVPKGEPAPDARLAARNLILQRKLAQKKRFDSADYYKARPTSSS